MSKKKRKTVTTQWFEIRDNGTLVESPVDPVKLGDDLAKIYMGTSKELDETAQVKLRKQIDKALGRSTPEVF